MKKSIYPLLDLFVIAVDQLTKYAVRANMQPGEKIPIIGDWMSIYYVQNTGVAFSMFSGSRFITVALTSILIIFCIAYAVKEYRDGNALTSMLLTLISAGGISNMIDRLTLGYVTDMISCGSFAVFNVADIFVTCSCVLMIILLFFVYKKEESEAS